MKEKLNNLLYVFKSLPKTSKIAIGFFAIVVLAIIPLTVLTAQQQQVNVQHASGGSSDIYVSTSGSDTNSGSQDSPLATINAASAIAKAGTTVHVAPGVYNQIVETDTSGSDINNPITYVSDEKWGAKIVSFGDASSTDSTWQNRGNYVTITGFDISGGKRIGILNRGSYVGVLRNRVHDVAVNYCENLGGAGIDSAYSPTQTGNGYTANLVFNVGPKPCSYVHGIYLQSNRESAFNNIVMNNGGIGIACTHGCNQADIDNNLIANNGFGIRIGWSQDASGKTNNSYVTNNIIFNNSGYAVYEYAQGIGTGNILSNNIIFGNNPNTCSANDCQATVNKAPQFLDYKTDGSGDYHPVKFSPGVDSGTNQGTPPVDYDENRRPFGSAFDIGPFEYVEPTASLSPSPTVSPSPNPTTTPSPIPSKCHYEYVACTTIACISGKPCPTCPPSKLVCPSSPPIQNPTKTPKPTAAPSAIKTSDINSDGKINIADYTILISCSDYSKDKNKVCNQNTSYKSNSDLNYDGRIDIDDLSIFIRSFAKSNK